MAFERVWKTKEAEISDEVLSCCLGSRVLAVLLANRGINTPEKIEKFLNPLKVRLLSPDAFSDMQKSAERIARAISAQEHITVYGDFDADGITSTALLYQTLKHIGASVDYYLPDRTTESHGLNTKALVNIISKRKTKLIITVDCGISNVSEINFANGFNTDVIITDHHEPPEVIPSAFAILNPKVKGNIDNSLDIESIESLCRLAGAGVAFKLSCKLLGLFKKEEFVNEILPLAAIGTIGDIVELTGENRSIAAMGIELLRGGKLKGIQQLLESSGITNIQSLTSETVAFTVVPRLNAAGRLDKPRTAMDILVSEDEDEIIKSVSVLNDLNETRQRLCEETFLQAKEMYEKDTCGSKKSIILFKNDWHIGIIGIVSSKLTEKYNKPVFLMTKDPNKENIIRCSCRSIKGIDIHALLLEHKDLFEGFGGHKMAAGFSFDANKISFEKFKKALNNTIDIAAGDFDFNKQTVFADMELEPEDITVETVNLIDKMQPFGAANPSPLFIMNKVSLCGSKMMGQNNNHLKIFIKKNNSKQFECVKWNCTDFNLCDNTELDIMFSLRLNYFNDNVSIELMLNDMHSKELENKRLNIKILDHRRKTNILMQVLDFLMSTKKHTAIYIKSAELKKKIKMPEEYIHLFFDEKNIPSKTEQLMFFEPPPIKDDFIRILKETTPEIIHLMNFNAEIITAEKYLAKLSGMLKYALKNLNGGLDILRAANALNSSSETAECALELLEAARMIDMERIDDSNIKIFRFHPLELSKIKQNELFCEFDERLKKENDFKEFYLTAPLDELKIIAGAEHAR